MDDRAEIEALVHEYAALVDDGDFDAVGRLFAEGSVCGPDGTPLATGADAVAALYTATTRRYEDGTPRSHHVTTNLTVRPDGDRATGRAYFTVFQATDGIPLQAVIAGRYLDEYHRTADGWRFARRDMHVRLTGDLAGHLLIDLPP